MSEFLIMLSFELNDKSLSNDWKTLSQEIDEDIAQADGFISRDFGIDENARVYCLVKWQSETHQQNFRQQLEARKSWPKNMERFGAIANVSTMTSHNLEIF